MARHRRTRHRRFAAVPLETEEKADANKESPESEGKADAAPVAFGKRKRRRRLGVCSAPVDQEAPPESEDKADALRRPKIRPEREESPETEDKADASEDPDRQPEREDSADEFEDVDSQEEGLKDVTSAQDQDVQKLLKAAIRYYTENEDAQASTVT